MDHSLKNRVTNEISENSYRTTKPTPFNALQDTVHAPKPIHVNENNNLTNSSNSTTTITTSSSSSKTTSELLSRLEDLLPRPATANKVDDDEEESSRDSSADSSKQSSVLSSPILSAPTTIRFPVKQPGKERSQAPDSGFCRWDECGVGYDGSGALLEHLQVGCSLLINSSNDYTLGLIESSAVSDHQVTYSLSIS